MCRTVSGRGAPGRSAATTSRNAASDMMPGLSNCGSEMRSISSDLTSATIEVDPEFGTKGLVGNSAVPLLNGADHDEENETDD
jgi:hypothetical protein